MKDEYWFYLVGSAIKLELRDAIARDIVHPENSGVFITVVIIFISSVIHTWKTTGARGWVNHTFLCDRFLTYSDWPVIVNSVAIENIHIPGT